MVKIAIGPYGGGSGISTYTSELSNALSTLHGDLDVTLLTWQGIEPPNREIPVLRLPRRGFHGVSDYAGGPFFKVFGATLDVRRVANQFDLVHLPDSTYGAFIRHPRLVLTTWGCFRWRLLAKWYSERFAFPVNVPTTIAGMEFLAMNSLALRTAKVIVSLLPLEYLPKGQVRENTVYIPPPLTLSYTSATTTRNEDKTTPQIDDHAIAFVFGSRDLSIKGKGAQLAINAFAKLLTSDKINAVLYMVGANGSSLDVPEPVRKNVIFTGFIGRRDYLRLLGPSRCFLALSHGEELDYACLEAMAAGCAVIASDIPAHYPVRDDETGRVVSRNSDSICSAMRGLTNEDIRRKLGRNAARVVNHLTNPVEVARKYSTIYERILYS